MFPSGITMNGAKCHVANPIGHTHPGGGTGRCCCARAGEVEDGNRSETGRGGNGFKSMGDMGDTTKQHFDWNYDENTQDLGLWGVRNFQTWISAEPAENQSSIWCAMFATNMFSYHMPMPNCTMSRNYISSKFFMNLQVWNWQNWACTNHRTNHKNGNETPSLPDRVSCEAKKQALAEKQKTRDVWVQTIVVVGMVLAKGDSEWNHKIGHFMVYWSNRQQVYNN